MRVDLKLKNLARVLNEATKNEDRVVVYHALSMYASKLLLNTAMKSDDVARNVNVNSSIIIDKVVSLFGEIGVVDKMLFKNIFKNVLKYHIPEETKDSNVYLDIITSTCFEDALGISQYFSKETVDLINNKFDLYRSTNYACSEIAETLKSIYHGE
jgi:hypothetical protein